VYIRTVVYLRLVVFMIVTAALQKPQFSYRSLLEVVNYEDAYH
jgi:hypothetical protein